MRFIIGAYMIEAGNIRELDKSISQVFDKIKQLTFFTPL
ncbi:hypothetical protein M085_1075, partial [Bacteroides fragilis str. 3986 N(B)19]